MPIKKGDYVLLLNEEHSYLKIVEDKQMQVSSGVIELKSLIGKKFGSRVLTHKGGVFVVVKPSIADIIRRKFKRLPQAIIPKDAGLIIAKTGIGSESKIVEAGTGSGFATYFLSQYVKKVFTYELRKDFYDNVQKNFNGLKVKNVKFYNKSILDGIKEKEVDLVLLDMQKAEEAVPLTFKALKPGGWLVVYSPYIEQVKACMDEINELEFTRVETIENISRGWDVRDHTLPKRQGIGHTGFLTFARKL